MKRSLLLSSLFICLIAKANVRDTTLPVKIVMRCSAHIDSNSHPNYIVNGKLIEDSLAVNFLSRLDVNLIINIEILKDAKSNMFYCGRDRNRGTIIITTKQTDFTPKPFCKPPEYQYDNYTL